MTDISKEAVALDLIWLDQLAAEDGVSPAVMLAERYRALSARVEELTSERDALSEYGFEATKAITGLTAGGSEFFAGKLPDGRYKADLPRCVKYVHETKQTLFRRVKQQREQGRLQALDEAIEAVKRENQRRLDLAPRLRLPALADELIPVLEALKGAKQ